MSNRTILLRVASYRDPELSRTIASAWASASYPERVKFAIVQQSGPETVDQLREITKDSRVAALQVDWTLARGIGWARRITDRMWRGEDFTLQVDAHTRFLSGWDTALISEWESLTDPRAVLSCYPGRFVLRDDASVYLYQVEPHLIVPAGFDNDGIPRQTGGHACSGGTPAMLVAGGFQFSSGSICAELEQIREAALGDEFIRSMQLFTHGWNVYAPGTVPLFHLYQQDATERAHTPSEDFRSNAKLERVLANLRMSSLEILGHVQSGAESKVVGPIRSREKFKHRLQELPG